MIGSLVAGADLTLLRAMTVGVDTKGLLLGVEERVAQGAITITSVCRVPPRLVRIPLPFAIAVVIKAIVGITDIVVVFAIKDGLIVDPIADSQVLTQGETKDVEDQQHQQGQHDGQWL
jgi:hypothetical protein